MDVENEYRKWRDRSTYLMVTLCQFIGIYMTTGMAGSALMQGGMGNIVYSCLIFFFIGIPVVYMEMVVGQFTGRDCIDIWRVRPFVSHIGYFLVIWQVIILICNHLYSSFVLHYFIISFENPIPYYQCGRWADDKCDIVHHNYTINKDCVTGKPDTRPDFCGKVHVTFPEAQYWKYYVLQWPPTDSYWNTISWRAITASAILCAVVYASCFKRTVAPRWFLYVMTFFPFGGYIVMLFGAMMQKGVVMNYPRAIDADLNNFVHKFRPIVTVKHVVYALSLGSGVTINVAGGGGFRAPVFSNAVLPVAAAITLTVLVVNVLALASCPYAFENNADPFDIIGLNLLILFEKIPRLVHSFTEWKGWLLIIYSSNTLVSLRMTVSMLHNLQELASVRSGTLAHYPGLTCLAGVLLLFLGTAPLMNHIGMNIIVLSARRYLSLVSVFFTILECSVFVIWYGVSRFIEDIHFMQGLKPNSFFKLVWVMIVLLLSYVFVYDLRLHLQSSNRQTVDKMGMALVFVLVVGTAGVAAVRAAAAWWRGRLRTALALEAAWGPRSELLRRSRAMFTAQAMTKEYLYRQYHLQAGVAARQRRSNARAPPRPFSERRITFNS